MMKDVAICRHERIYILGEYPIELNKKFMGNFQFYLATCVDCRTTKLDRFADYKATRKLFDDIWVIYKREENMKELPKEQKEYLDILVGDIMNPLLEDKVRMSSEMQFLYRLERLKKNYDVADYTECYRINIKY
uniref:Uncharacterized protein n=1 Tax=viral metagenome TaxID=1070528 RepID=A0A6M3IES8_9ZZZZ